MEELDEVLLRVTVPTHQLTAEIIQVVLIRTKKLSSCEQLDHVCDTWNKIVESLSNHLQVGLNEFDDQLLCATCFYTALCLSNKQSYYTDKITQMIQEELALRNQGNKNNPNTSHIVSLMYGLYQSPFLIQKCEDNLSNFISHSFDLLISMAYDYSRYTYIVFKTMNSFKKLCGTARQEHIQNYYQKLLNLVNHNWESPITGVRDLNRGVFQILVSVIDIPMCDGIIKEVNGFYWNKAKYLMLSETISEEFKHDVKIFTQQDDWVEGLLYSLHRPGLVSAGADMYYALLKKLKYEDEWCDIFLQGILKILAFSSNKATENFSNYWCLPTLKKFPSLAMTILEELQMLEDSEQKFYSCLCILKQANKLGLVTKNWDSEEEFKFTENTVLSGIEHYNPNIRMLSFDIVCVSQSKQMPSQKEYELVLNYLDNNVNSDCTVLRLSMLSSLNSFLTRLQSLFINDQKTCQDKNKHLVDFCISLQKFAIDTLNINGNYQRKITSVKMCKLILDCFNNLPKKREKQVDICNIMTLSQMLVDKGCWHIYDENLVMKLLSLLKDSSDDVRENVVQLLLTHYHQQLRSKRLLNHLIDEALASMRSKFFYQTSCGRNMFKLITNLLLTDQCNDTTFTSVEEVFLFGYKELAAEYEMKTDIVKSIETGKQLHSLISILHVVLEVCLQNSYTISILDDHIGRIILILEEISNQFAWEELTSTSSDFSKMSDMVQKMIASSGYETCDEIDQTKISGLHQIVLNCLWLNVKASCELSVLLIQLSKEQSLINRCLNVITHVLETCRHKGAIEAAGAALGRAVHHLTCLPDEVLSRLPYELLRCKLQELICETGVRGSVTRRGAGLSIMVHRLVSGDGMKGKPLFHHFMETLLETCSSTFDMADELTAYAVETRDLPKAVLIHLQTRAVTDSSLTSHMTCYSARLAALAFGNLTSPHWQIRNAALQLYGALIPKLIGQKKASGCDDETVACDEFRTHSPELWQHIKQSLETCHNTDKIQAHSNLVPILNILANCARRYNFSSDMAEQKDSDFKLLKSLVVLLGSPLYTVRRLTAKCIYNIYLFDLIYDTLVKHDVDSENDLHGCLTLLMICYKNYSSKYKDHFNTLQEKFDVILNNGTHSYLCRQLFEEMFSEDLNITDIYETLSNVCNNVHVPGIFVWADRRIERFVINVNWETVPEILEMLLKHEYEHYSKIILKKISSDCNIPRQFLLPIAEKILSFTNKYNSSVIWEILYEISLRIHLEVDVIDILKYLEKKEFTYKLRFAIPFIARVGSNNTDLLALSKIVYSLSNPETTDVDMRYIAALANNNLAEKFKILSDSVKINTIKSAVILLQDEDEDVRNRSANFYKNIIKSDIALHPNICLCKILDRTFLHHIFSDQKRSIQSLCQELCDVIDSNKSHLDEYNPFANDSKNIYMEVEVVKELIYRIKNSTF